MLFDRVTIRVDSLNSYHICPMLQCQAAALDELFGKPGVCFPRYQTAQILFHSLAQQTDHPQDKNILGKCNCHFHHLI